MEWLDGDFKNPRGNLGQGGEWEPSPLKEGADGGPLILSGQGKCSVRPGATVFLCVRRPLQLTK